MGRKCDEIRRAGVAECGGRARGEWWPSSDKVCPAERSIQQQQLVPQSPGLVAAPQVVGALGSCIAAPVEWILDSGSKTV